MNAHKTKQVDVVLLVKTYAVQIYNNFAAILKN